MRKENIALKIPKEIVGSQAFNLEYEKTTLDAQLRDEIVSYLGEYRFELQKFNYNLEFSRGADGVLGLRDDRKKELMQEKTSRAIEERKARNLPVHREIAEDLGIKSLDEQIATLNPGEKARIFWGSPPGPKDQGYGDYGFIFSGDVHKTSQDTATVAMTAIRVEQERRDMAPYNKALSLLSGISVDAYTPEDLLKSPQLTRNTMSNELIDKVIGAAFSGKLGKGKDDVFQKVIQKMDPMIGELTRYIKFGTKDEKIQAFNALENYALDLKKRYEAGEQKGVIYMADKRTMSIVQMVDIYGKQKAPEVAGSCGKTGEIKSSNVLHKYADLKKALEDDEGFECPKCHYETKEPVGNQCPGCRLTKEEFAKQGGAVC